MLTLRKKVPLEVIYHFTLWTKSCKNDKNLSISSCVLGISSEAGFHQFFKNSIPKVLPHTRHQETLIGLKPEGKPPEDRHLQHQNSKPVAFMSGLSDKHITLLTTKGLRHRNRWYKSKHSLHLVSTSRKETVVRKIVKNK